MRAAGALACCLLLAVAGSVSGQQNPHGRLPLGGLDDPTVFLLRDPEVLGELRATAEQRTALGELADRLDDIIWPRRNQSAETAQAAWQQATQTATREAARILTAAQRTRLEEIVLWIQGTRALVRDDVARTLALSASQRQAIQQILDSTAGEIAELSKRAAAGEAVASLERQAAQLNEEGQRAILSKLNDEQRRRWAALAGKRIDVARLGRVSFRAPRLLAGENDWLNGPATADHRTRRVTAVHFFANGCINCIRNYEHYQGWDRSFREQGLVIVGIHTPETEAEHDLDRLRRKVAEAGFRFPILIDNQKLNWTAWGNTMWPSVYLVDNQGRIRYWWYGELNWQGAEGEKLLRQRIEELLAEAD